MHASSHVSKTYLVKVSGRPEEAGIQRLRKGVLLRPIVRTQGERRRVPAEKPAKTAPAKIELIRDAPNPWYEVILIEGRTRQIRRMFEEIGHRVEKIKRVRYGPLILDVEPGQFRMLTPSEITRLRSAAGLTSPKHKPRRTA
jgi:23S rRNA pseudouridine2605 synthase